MQPKYFVLQKKKRAFENIGLSRRTTICCKQEMNRDLQTQFTWWQFKLRTSLLHWMTTQTQMNDTSELMLFIQDMNDNFYFMIEDMKGTTTCVVLYERMSITADRRKLPRAVWPQMEQWI